MSASSNGPPTLPPGLEAVRSDTGLERIDVSPGEGSPVRSGQQIRVRYRVWLLDGTLADSTPEDGTPASFIPGEGRVIPALEEGVVGMKPGGARRLIVPSDLAYGPTGLGKRIPPYATLIVDLELVSAV